MSDGGGGADGGPSYGHGGGFWQSPNAFSGLTNTDLRPRRRRRRPVPLLNTSWVAGRRRKGERMRKDFTDQLGTLFGTLKKSVIQISTAGAEDGNALIERSIDEFREALLDKIAPALTSNVIEEPLHKGLNHVALFANALRDAGRAVEAIKTGRPTWMVSDSNAGTPEIVTPEIEEDMDRWIRVGVTALQSMVNETASEVTDAADLERAERTGELAKMLCGDTEILIKTDLPEDYRDLLTDPLELFADTASMGQEFLRKAAELAGPFLEAGQMPDELIEAFPELFEPGLFEVPMGKAAVDENAGAGGDPDAANDPGDGGDDDEGTPSDPIDMITRLASIIVVVAGSLKQAGEQDDDEPNGGDASGFPDDTNAAQPLQRRAPMPRRPVMANSASAFGDIDLAKIHSGEIEVHASVADALEKALRDAGQLEKTQSELRLLQATVARMQAQPAVPKGAIFAIAKSEDNTIRSGAAATKVEDDTARIGELAKTNPEAAARELMKSVHAGGGTPLVPPR
jgi:hypothetical protein